MEDFYAPAVREFRLMRLDDDNSVLRNSRCISRRLEDTSTRD